MARKDDALEQSGTDQFQETDRSSHRTHLASTVAARSQTGSCLVEEASISEMRSAEKCIYSYLKGGTFALDWRSGAIELSRGQRIRVGGSPGSRWMPWELGFFDGFRTAVAVLPVAKNSSETFCGQEFLGLYPYIDGTGPAILFINRGTASSSRLGSVSSTANVTFAKSWLKEFAGTNRGALK